MMVYMNETRYQAQFDHLDYLSDRCDQLYSDPVDRRSCHGEILHSDEYQELKEDADSYSNRSFLVANSLYLVSMYLSCNRFWNVGYVFGGQKDTIWVVERFSDWHKSISEIPSDSKNSTFILQDYCQEDT